MNKSVTNIIIVYKDNSIEVESDIVPDKGDYIRFYEPQEDSIITGIVESCMMDFTQGALLVEIK